MRGEALIYLMKERGNRKGSIPRDWGVSLVLFSLALVPRALGLKAFSPVDEATWAQASLHFLTAILDRNWAGTFQRGMSPAYMSSPGVITTWGGAAGLGTKYIAEVLAMPGVRSVSLVGLQEFLQKVPPRSIGVDFLLAMRTPFILVASFSVVMVYLLTKKLFDSKVAILASLILAFDPIYIAHSRFVLLDALVTSFMILSYLSFTVYLRSQQSLRYLAFSGITAGLAFLTKSLSLSLVPSICVLAFFTHLLKQLVPSRLDREKVIRLVWTFGIWGGVAALTFILLWPAMWVEPMDTVRKVMDKAISHAGSSHMPVNFFWGKIRPDPGFLFYPVHLLFRTTPLTLLGTAASLATLLGKREEHKRLRAGAVILWVYALLYMALMSVGATKADRYLLPTLPAFDILAAVGWYSLAKTAWRRLISKGQGRVKGHRLKIASYMSVLLLQAGFSLPYHPYYLSYYNPLVGGGAQASEVLLVGWGEGLDEAGRYLDRKNDMAEVSVAAWYSDQSVRPFFHGRLCGLTREGLFWKDVDYVVFYLNQVQRQLPDQEVVHFFQTLEAEHIVRINGIDYAWIYQAPKPLPEVLLPKEPVARFGDSILLIDYVVIDSKDTPPGKLRLHLLWRAFRRMKEDYTVYLKLVNGAYKVWGQQDGRPYWGGMPTNSWEKGQVVRDQREIEILPGTPPGPYLVEVILYDPYRQLHLEPDDGSTLLLGPVIIPPRDPPPVESLDIEHPMEAIFGGKVRLLGYNVESGFRPGDNIHLTLFWQCLAEMEQDYTVFTHFIDGRGNIQAQKDNEPVDGFYSTTRWKAGEIVRDQYDLVIPPEVSPGQYRLEVGMYLVETGERLDVSEHSDSQASNKVVLQSVNVKGR